MLLEICPLRKAALFLTAGLLALLPAVPNWAQGTLPSEYFSVNDGLSDRAITDILKTPDGLLWMGTVNGLNRFDGYNFLVFDSHPSNSHQLSDSNIRELFLDQAGHIIIVFNSSYALFDRLDPHTHEREVVRLLPGTGVRGIPRDIAATPQGDIVALSVSRDTTYLFEYRPDGNFELLFARPEAHGQLSASVSLLPLNDGTFLINDSELGLRHFDASGQLLWKADTASFPGLEHSNNYPGICSILHQDANGRVWVALQGQRGMCHYDPNQHLLSYAEGLPRWQYFTRLWEDESGQLLLCNSKNHSEVYPLQGIVCIQPDYKVVQFDEILGVSRWIVSAFSNDFFENLILGIDTGLKIVQNKHSSIKKYLAENVGADRRGAVMRGVTGDENGQVYFAREVDAWYAFDPSTGLLDTLQLLEEVTGEPVALSCGRNIAWSDGYLWGISCLNQRNGRLHRYDPQNCTVKTYTFDFQFTAFTPGQHGGIWLVAEPPNPSGMLVYFDTAQETFSVFNDSEGQNPLREASPRFILESSEGLLWIGTENGLYAVDPAKRSSKVYRARTGQASGLASNILYTIHEDENKQLWLGTTNGFNIFDPATESFRHFNQQNGLASNIVCGFVPDQNGNYWISTFNGLSYFNAAVGNFRNFYQKDGLSHDEFNRFSYYKDSYGNIYMGGVNGMNVFRTEDLLVNYQTPPPILTSITRFNSRLDSTMVQYAGLNGIQELSISPYDTYISLSYTIPNYASPRRNQFKTWLEGYDKDWIYQGTAASTRFNSLPPGQYVLHIKGADANGNWSEQALSIPLTVNPPFYRTPFFFLLCALAIAALLYAYFHHRLERRLEVERIRTKLSSDLHDEVSGLLAGIAMQTDLLQLTVKDDNSKEKLKKMGEVSRTAMSKMSDVIWSIDSRKDRVEDLLLRMREHTEEVLAPLNIQYRFQAGKLDRNKKISVTLRQNLYFIFKEAVNNVAKHSWATEVNITFRNIGNQCILQVEDNGLEILRQRQESLAEAGASLTDRGQSKLNYGQGKKRQKTGQGLANMEMRAQRLGAKVKVDKDSKGFSITLWMPKFA